MVFLQRFGKRIRVTSTTERSHCVCRRLEGQFIDLHGLRQARLEPALEFTQNVLCTDLNPLLNLKSVILFFESFYDIDVCT